MIADNLTFPKDKTYLSFKQTNAWRIAMSHIEPQLKETIKHKFMDLTKSISDKPQIEKRL